MPRIQNFFSNTFSSLLATALPSACITCGMFQEKFLCPDCAKLLAYQGLFNYKCCLQCGIALTQPETLHQQCGSCNANPPYFDETYCLDRYEGLLQDALHQLKYLKRLAFAQGLANTWNRFLANILQNIEADYLLVVPLSQEKLLTRGFNQSWELARKIRLYRPIHRLPRALGRQHHAEHQASRKRSLRTTATQGIFYIEENYRAMLSGKKIIVFDDVMTTGATLNEIARILKENGASRIINWVLLRTSKPTQPSLG
jgi:ComF family protein